MKLNRFARRVAAMDEKILENCPPKDKIWATQIGYALMVTFVVIWGIAFYSMTIFHGADVTLDIENLSLEFNTSVIGYAEYVMYATIAAVVALLIFFTDRAFYQSDWFMHMPYGVEVPFWKRLLSLAGNTKNIGFRLLLSLFLAYGFSSFLELKFYESELLTFMQKKHFKENKQYYNDMHAYAGKLDDEMEKLSQKRETLKQKILAVESGVTGDDAVLNRYKTQMHQLQTAHQKAAEDLASFYAAKRKKLENVRRPIAKQMQQMQQAYDTLELKYQAEVGGLKEIELDGKVIRASGIPTEGRRAKFYKKRMQQLQREMKHMAANLKKIDAQQQSLLQEEAEQKRTLERKYAHEAQQTAQEIAAYKKASRARLQANAKQIRADLQKELERVTARLEDITQNKQQYILQHYREVMRSPAFVPFRDGPISRLMAMEKLKQEPGIGKEIAYFSIMIKTLLVFFEIAPILSKLFFGPPTVYAAALQMQTKRATEQILENDGLSKSEIEEQIALERKKMELEEAKRALEKVRQERMSEERKTVFSKAETTRYEQVLDEIQNEKAA